MGPFKFEEFSSSLTWAVAKDRPEIITLAELQPLLAARVNEKRLWSEVGMIGSV